MRRILLHEQNAYLFDEEMLPDNLDYFVRHKDTFRRMWQEQGKTFWSRFVLVFKSYITRYSLLGELPCDSSQLHTVLNFAFVYISQNFVEGKANQAKNLILNIAALGQNKHKYIFLDSKSLTKDPFYTKETRDLFREFFGPANEKASYVKVYLLTPVYMRFGGSVCRCLEMWKDAMEIDPEDDSYWTPPQPLDLGESKGSTLLCPVHLQDCNMKYYQEYVAGDPRRALFLPDAWGIGNPRLEDPENPLYDEVAALMQDWRYGLSCEKFQEFVAYCSSKYVPPEEQCPECRALAKKLRKKLKRKMKKKQAAMQHDPSEPCSCAGELTVSPVSVEETLSQFIPDDIKSQIKRIAKISGAPSTCECSCHRNPPMQIPSVEELNKNQLFRFEEQRANSSPLPLPDLEKPVKRVCFTANSGSFKHKQDILVPSDDSGSLNLLVVFNVVRRQDPTTNCKEINLTISSVKPAKEKQRDNDLLKEDAPSLTHSMEHLPHIEVFNGDKLSLLLASLPQQCRWAEGTKWCAVSVDYSSVENYSHENVTKFVAKISSVLLGFAKTLMESLLLYIVQRKKRDSAGWVLQEDDIFSLCVSFKQHVQKLSGTVFSIYTGLDLLDSLTSVEERTLLTAPSEVTIECFEGRINFSSNEDVSSKLSELSIAPHTESSENKHFSNVSSQTPEYTADQDTSNPDAFVRPKTKVALRKQAKHVAPQLVTPAGIGTAKPYTKKKKKDDHGLPGVQVSKGIKPREPVKKIRGGITKPYFPPAPQRPSASPNMPGNFPSGLPPNFSSGLPTNFPYGLPPNFPSGLPPNFPSGLPPNFPPNFPQFSNDDTIVWTSGKNAFIMGNDRDTSELIEYLRAAGNKVMPQASPWSTGVSPGVPGGNQGNPLLSFPAGLGGVSVVQGSPAGNASSPVKLDTAAVKTASESKSNVPASKKKSKSEAKQGGTHKTVGMTSQEGTTNTSDSKHQPDSTRASSATDSKRPEGEAAQGSKNGKLESDANNDVVRSFSDKDHADASRNIPQVGGDKAISDSLQTSSSQSGASADLKITEAIGTGITSASKKASREGSSKTLRVCANCLIQEPKPKTYSKCQRCKDESVQEARFYCSRDCQISDWTAKHRDEHKSGVLV